MVSVGGGRESLVGRERFTSWGGVGRIWPKPSGRRGRGEAPTTHGGGAVVVGVLGGVVGAVVGVVVGAWLVSGERADGRLR